MSGSRQVLEIPRVIDDNIAGNPAADELGTGDDDDDGPALGPDDESAPDGENSPDEVGTLQNYRNRALRSGEGVVVYAPAIIGRSFARRPRGINLPTAPAPFIPPWRVGVPMILRPTSSGPFLSTSPMLMPPRFVSPSGAMLGSSWSGAY